MRRGPTLQTTPSATSELPSWARLDEGFDDVRIVDFDARRTTVSRVHDSMRVVYLKLDRAPDRFWVRLFQENRGMRSNPLRFGLWLDDDWISFDCRIDDIEPTHLPDIQSAIDYANRRYREVLEQRRAERVATVDEGPSEAAKLDALAARLRERFAPGGSAGAPDAAPPPMATPPAAALDTPRTGGVPDAPRTRAPNDPVGDAAEHAEWHRRLGLDTLVTTGSRMSVFGPQARGTGPAVDTTPGPARTLLREVDLGAFKLEWTEPAPPHAPPAEPPRFTAPASSEPDDPTLEFERRRRALRERLRSAAQPAPEEPPRGDE